MLSLVHFPKSPSAGAGGRAFLLQGPGKGWAQISTPDDPVVGAGTRRCREMEARGERQGQPLSSPSNPPLPPCRQSGPTPDPQAPDPQAPAKTWRRRRQTGAARGTAFRISRGEAGQAWGQVAHAG